MPRTSERSIGRCSGYLSLKLLTRFGNPPVVRPAPNTQLPVIFYAPAVQAATRSDVGDCRLVQEPSSWGQTMCWVSRSDEGRFDSCGDCIPPSNLCIQHFGWPSLYLLYFDADRSSGGASVELLLEYPHTSSCFFLCVCRADRCPPCEILQ